MGARLAPPSAPPKAWQLQTRPGGVRARARADAGEPWESRNPGLWSRHTALGSCRRLRPGLCWLYVLASHLRRLLTRCGVRLLHRLARWSLRAGSFCGIFAGRAESAQATARQIRSSVIRDSFCLETGGKQLLPTGVWTEGRAQAPPEATRHAKAASLFVRSRLQNFTSTSLNTTHFIRPSFSGSCVAVEMLAAACSELAWASLRAAALLRMKLSSRDALSSALLWALFAKLLEQPQNSGRFNRLHQNHGNDIILQELHRRRLQSLRLQEIRCDLIPHCTTRRLADWRTNWSGWWCIGSWGTGHLSTARAQAEVYKAGTPRWMRKRMIWAARETFESNHSLS